jgi:uncharacterized protein (DUF2235 family)
MPEETPEEKSRNRPRNIILLSDGTGNSAASPVETNVRRLYEALDLADPKELHYPRQFAYYDDGVGTSSFRALPESSCSAWVAYARRRSMRRIMARRMKAAALRAWRS